jgi:hypothetical protein
MLGLIIIETISRIVKIVTKLSHVYSGLLQQPAHLAFAFSFPIIHDLVTGLFYSQSFCTSEIILALVSLISSVKINGDIIKL